MFNTSRLSNVTGMDDGRWAMCRVLRLVWLYCTNQLLEFPTATRSQHQLTCCSHPLVSGMCISAPYILYPPCSVPDIKVQLAGRQLDALRNLINGRKRGKRIYTLAAFPRWPWFSAAAFTLHRLECTSHNLRRGCNTNCSEYRKLC